jgi:hypothetical protein
MSPPTPIWFRRAILILAAVLGLQALWILAAEITRPVLPSIAVSENVETETWSRSRNAASLSALFGMVRGDLWADYALTYADFLWSEKPERADTDTSKAIALAHDAAERALRFAPHDAKAWLLLAGLYSRFDWLNGKSAASLRMSYYTATNEIELFPLRVRLAAQSDSTLADIELRTFVQRDIRIIVTREPELKPAILIAYRDALPAGRQFIERTLGELDPALVVWLRSGEHL